MNVRRNKYTPEALIKHKFVSILRSREKFENVYEITSLQYGDWFRTSEVIIIFFYIVLSHQIRSWKITISVDIIHLKLDIPVPVFIPVYMDMPTV